MVYFFTFGNIMLEMDRLFWQASPVNRQHYDLYCGNVIVLAENVHPF